MLRRALLAVILLSAAAPGFAQRPMAPPSPRIFTPYATLERTPEGWRCLAVGFAKPELLRELRASDLLTKIDSVPLAGSTAIGMLQLLRTVEFGLAQSVEIHRAGATLRWGEDGTPQIFASQDSFTVIRSDVPGLRAGDVLDAIGETHFTSMMTQVHNPLTSVVTIELRAGKTLKFRRADQSREITVGEPATIRLLLFALDLPQGMPETELRGLNTADRKMERASGSWTLLHFWATWCRPCMEHMADIRELSQRKDLTVLSIGFADTNERLAAIGTKEPALKVYAPSAKLQRDLAIVGIPFDLLLDPDGKAVLAIAGNMHADELKSNVLRYVVP